MFALKDGSFALGKAIAALMMFGATSASADTYVDDNTGVPGACSLAAPCATVQQGVDAAGPGETVRVDGGIYSGSVTVGGGRSVVGQDFVGPIEAERELTASSGSAITVSASGAGTISGFDLAAPAATSVVLSGPAVITQNKFISDKTPAAFWEIDDNTAGDQVVISQNEFRDPSPGSGDQQGAIDTGGSSPSVSSNTFDDYLVAIDAQGIGAAAIRDNTIRGTYTIGFQGKAIQISNGSHPIVTGNLITDPGTGPSLGLYVVNGSVTMARNRIFGHSRALYLDSTTPAVTLHGDVLASQTDGAIYVFNPTNSPSLGDVEATNLTVYDSLISLESSDLLLDSSILLGPNSGIGAAGTSTCTITNSRGEASVPGGSGCENFQTTADPLLADPAGGDFHLLPGSPMIDAGNPAAPVAPNLTDFDGDTRALPGGANCASPAVRDIGADEWVRDAIDCSAPDTAIDSGPTGSTTSARPTFAFSSTLPSSSFECRFDAAAFGPCSGPGATHSPSSALTLGSHTFAVRAISANEVPDPSPATRDFTLIEAGEPPAPRDTTAPQTSFRKGPKRVVETRTRTARVRLSFVSSEQASRFECKLDKRSYRRCVSPVLRGVGIGRHTFRVRAIDAAGNTDLTPAVRSWRVVRVPAR